MLLFIEGYPYSLDEVVRDNLTIRDVLKDVVSVPVKEDKYSFGYVGYCYSKAAKDVVFFLPKVVLAATSPLTKYINRLKNSVRRIWRFLTDFPLSL